MIARVLRVSVLVVGFGLVAGPVPVSAQLGQYCQYAEFEPELPPETWWCFNLTGLDFRYTESRYLYSFRGIFSGNVFDLVDGLEWFGWFTPTLFAGASSDVVAFTPGEPTSVNGYTLRAADDTYPTTEVSPDELTFVWLASSGPVPDRGCGDYWTGYCEYTVPEPGTLPLMLPGLLALGLVGLRRAFLGIA